jgi:hypothetical protein
MEPSRMWELAPPVSVLSLALMFTYGRALEYLLQRTLRKIDTVTAEDPEVAHDLHGQVQAIPGRLLRLLVARALLRRHRPNCRERLALGLLAAATKIVGADEQALFLKQARGDHYANKKAGWSSTRLLVDAFAQLLSAPQGRWQERISPWLAATFPRASERVNWYLDTAARSASSALIMVGPLLLVPATTMAYATMLMLGERFHGLEIGVALEFAVFFAVPGAVINWQRGRNLALFTGEKAKR